MDMKERRLMAGSEGRPGWEPTFKHSVDARPREFSKCKNVFTFQLRARYLAPCLCTPLDTTLIALLQFPSADAAEAFVNDPQYARYAAARKGGSESRFQLIDDTDLAGTIPYLPKG